MRIRKNILLLFFLFFLSNTHAQDFQTSVDRFWTAFQEEDTLSIIQYGLKIIEFREGANETIDSIEAFIYLETAINLTAVKRYEDAVILFEKNFYRSEDMWGENNMNSYSSAIYVVDAFFGLEEYEMAINWCNKAKYISEKLYGSDSPHYIATITRLIAVYEKSANFEKGIELFEYNKENLHQTLPNDEWYMILNHVAYSYKKLDYHLQAIETYDEIYNFYNTELGQCHPWTVTILSQIAELYRGQLINPQKSLAYSNKAFECINKNNLDIKQASLLVNNLACTYSDLEQYDKGISLLEDFIRQHGPYLSLNPEIASPLHYNLSGFYGDIGKFNESIKSGEQALIAFEQTLGKESNEYQGAVNNIATALASIGKHQDALTTLYESLFSLEQRIGKNNKYYIITLSNIGSIYLKLYELDKALIINKECLDLTAETFGKNSERYIESLNNLAITHSYLGDYNQVFMLNKEIEIILSSNDKLSEALRSVLISNLGVTYSEQGNYSKALELHFSSLDIKKKLFGSNSLRAGKIYNDIAVVYSQFQDYENSLIFFTLYLNSMRDNLGKLHADYALGLTNLSSIYNSLGDFEVAKELNLEASEIYKEIFGEKHPKYANSLLGVSTAYMHVNDLEKAEGLILEAAKIFEVNLTDKHPLYLDALNNLAVLFGYKNDHLKSLELNRKILESLQNNYPNSDVKYVNSLTNIALNYFMIGDIDNSVNYFKKVVELFFQHYQLNRLGSSKGTQENFKTSLDARFINFVNASIEGDIFTDSLYHHWLNINGLLASNQSQLFNELIKSGDTNMQQLAKNLRNVSIKLNKAYELPIEEREKLNLDTEKLLNEKERLESQLSKFSQSFANQFRTFSIDAVRGNLQEDEALIDIIRVPRYDYLQRKFSEKTTYLICIVRSNNEVEFVPIDFKELEEEFMMDYTTFTAGEYKKEQIPDPVSYERFWLPISERIGEAKTIYIAANGVYNNINLTTLYNTESDKYLLEEKDIRIVNSARDFVLLKEQQAFPSVSDKIALFGYPNYNASTDPIVEKDLLAGTRDLDEFWIDSLTRGGFTASLLPGTKQEVTSIAGLFQPKKWEVMKYLENEANETNIKALQQPRVLHIATHGYFFEDIPLNLESANQRFMGIERQTLVQDPMLRSGLLFAGANRTLKGEEQEGENGLLSAAEASLLNLRGTELVVLSACETGRGEVKNSEGVYGLRKAFTDAGARNLIMSLWKVDDEVTKEFMTRFYEMWLNENKTIREAFNQTQLEIKAKYPQPYYWGAFILVGE